ncbi:MAG: hypothetical protein JWM04_1531 [Verrucomicrobiales bacterium]|nr:hypothetical protein [Verrucomicrobiales bacterium]
MRKNNTLGIALVLGSGLILLLALSPRKTIPAESPPPIPTIVAPQDSSMASRLSELRRRTATPGNPLDEIKRRLLDRQTKRAELSELMDSIPGADLPEMAQFAYDIIYKNIHKPGKLSAANDFFGGIMWRWNKTDSDAVKVWAPEHIRDAEAWRVAGNLAGAWSMTDRAEAFQLAAKFRSSGLRQGAVAGILERWAVTDPQAAVQYAMSKPEGTDRVNLLGTIGLVWGKSNYPAASAFVKSLPEGAERAHFQHCIDYGH